MHTLLVLDHHPERLRDTLVQSKSWLNNDYPLMYMEFNGPIGVAVWGAAHVPMRAAANENGLALDVGHVVHEDGALRPPGNWLIEGAEYPDGYFLSLHWDGLTLHAGVDRLGIMPLWYLQDGDRFLISTSVGLLRALQRIRSKPDEAAILSVLAFGHPVDNRSIWQEVRRLPAGDVLRKTALGKPCLVGRYVIPDTPISSAAFPELLATADDILHRGLGRELDGASRCWLALSGGRDSRLLAGHLSKLPVTTRAITFGCAGESDLECAQSVARSLGMPQRIESLEEAGGEASLFDFIFETQASCGFPGTGFHSLGDSL